MTGATTDEVTERSRLGVRARLTLVASAIALVAFGLAGVVLYRTVSTTLHSALDEELLAHAVDVRDEVERGAPPSTDSGIDTQVLRASGEVLRPAGADALLRQSDIAAASRSTVAVHVDRDGRELRAVALPARSAADGAVVVVAAASTRPITKTEERLVVRMVVAGFFMAVASAGAAWFLSGAALRPVRAMSRRARSLSTGDPEERLPLPPGNDEIAELGVTLNEMLGRIGDARLRERAFIDDASHDLRAPLAVMRGELELALLEQGDAPGEHQDDRVTQALASALEEADRLAALTDHLLLLARADAGTLTTVVEPLILREVVDHAAERLASGAVRVVVEGSDAGVCGDRVALARAVSNVLGNAVHWADTEVHCAVGTEGDRVVLRVSDDGPGFPPDYLAHAFDRFRRGDPARQRSGSSSGLGLAIAAAVVEAHDGTISVGNGSDLGGAWVEVTLPGLDAVDR